MIAILGKYFSIRCRSKEVAEDEYLENHGDGKDGGAEDQEGKAGQDEEGQNEEGQDDEGQVGEDTGESMEVGSEPSVADVNDKYDVQLERLAYFLGGTPRRTQELGSPWSATLPSSSPVPPTEKPALAPLSPKTMQQVDEALLKLE